MLDVIPDVALYKVLKLLDRDEIRVCRQVNRRLRSTIESRRTMYPMHPAAICINSKGADDRVFAVEVKSLWSRKRIVRYFRVLSKSMEADRNGHYSGLVESFFEEGSEEPIDVSFGVALFREVITGLLEHFDFSALQLSGATQQMLMGISQATRRPWQTVPFMHIFPMERLEMKIAMDAVEFCAPTELELHNFFGDMVKHALASPVLQNVKCVEIRNQETITNMDFNPEVFHDVKCEKLLIVLDPEDPIPMNARVWNGVLKQWCNGERNFAAEECKGWILITHQPDFVDSFRELLQGVPFEVIFEESFLQDEDLSVPPCYFKISRCTSESLIVRFDNGMEADEVEMLLYQL